MQSFDIEWMFQLSLPFYRKGELKGDVWNNPLRIQYNLICSLNSHIVFFLFFFKFNVMFKSCLSISGN